MHVQLLYIRAKVSQLHHLARGFFAATFEMLASRSALHELVEWTRSRAKFMLSPNLMSYQTTTLQLKMAGIGYV